MIPVEDVYNSLLTILREDKRGIALSLDEYNRIASLVNERVFAKKYAQFETTLEISDALTPFLSSDNLNIIANSIIFPTDYKIMIGKPYSSSAGRHMDYVTQLELYERLEDYLTKPSKTYPVWTFLGDAGGFRIAQVYPATLSGYVTIRYLKEPATPFYDYYVNNTTLVTTYMDVGASVVIPTGCTYRDKTIGDGVTSFTSTSVDWEWGSGELSLILNMLASILGVTFPDQFLLEASNLQETKEDNQ